MSAQLIKPSQRSTSRTSDRRRVNNRPTDVVELFEPLAHGRKVGIGQCSAWISPVQQRRLQVVRGDPTLFGVGDLVIEQDERRRA